MGEGSRLKGEGIRFMVSSGSLAMVRVKIGARNWVRVRVKVSASVRVHQIKGEGEG